MGRVTSLKMKLISIILLFNRFNIRFVILVTKYKIILVI